MVNGFGSSPDDCLERSNSESFMARLELTKSAVPLINAAIPVPDPPPETSTETSDFRSIVVVIHGSRVRM